MKYRSILSIIIGLYCNVGYDQQHCQQILKKKVLLHIRGGFTYCIFFHYQPPTILSSLLSAKYLQPILNCNNSKVESSPPISAKICHPIKILNAHNWVEQGSLVLYFLIKFCNFDPSSCYMLLSNAYTQCNLICTIYIIDFLCFYDKFLHISRHIQSNGIENTFLKTLSNVHQRWLKVTK